MQADFAVELGKDDPALELPWAGEDGGARFLDLRARPELLLELPETLGNRELSEFLATLNAPASRFLTAKCDTWYTTEISAEEEVFGATIKYGCYVDLCFLETVSRFSFAAHQNFAAEVCGLLTSAPEVGASAELAVRRCYFHHDSPGSESDPGHYITMYVSGFGDQEEEARLRWSIGLKLLQNAIVQLAAHHQTEW